MSLNLQQKGDIYYDFEKLYNLADSILDIVEKPGNQHSALYTELVSPIIDKLEITGQRVAQIWADMEKESRNATAEEQKELGTLLRQLFSSITSVFRKIDQNK